MEEDDINNILNDLGFSDDENDYNIDESNGVERKLKK